MNTSLNITKKMVSRSRRADSPNHFRRPIAVFGAMAQLYRRNLVDGKKFGDNQ
jgi:hypothetical protein